MNPISYFKNHLPTGSIITKENALILTGLIAEVALVVTLVFFNVHVGVIGLTLVATNLAKLAFLSRKFKKQEDSEGIMLKKMQEKDTEIFDLKKQVSALTPPKQD